MRYYYMNSNIADFGLILNALINTPTEWERAFWGHIHFIQILLGQFTRIIPENLLPYYLINFQNTIVLFSAIMIKKHFGNIAGIALILYIPVWSLLYYDFHFDFMAIPILTGFFISIKEKNNKKAVAYASSLILIKEIFCLQVIFCGIYLIIKDYKKSIYGIFLILFGSLSFYIYTKYLIPNFSGVNNVGIDSPAYNHLGTGILDKIFYISENLKNIIVEIINNRDKIIFILILFFQLIFLPLISPLPMLVALPIIGVLLLSNNQNYYSYNTHYMAGLIIPIIISYSNALQLLIKRITNKKYIFLIIYTPLFVGLALFTTFPLSRYFISEKYTDLNFKNYTNQKRIRIIKDIINENIPLNKKIFISAQNSINYYPLYARERYLPFPYGVDRPENFKDFKKIYIDDIRYADYVLIDLKKNLYIYDIGCNFQNEECKDKKIYSDFMRIKQDILEKNYYSIAEYDGFIIYKRLAQQTSK